MTCDASLQFGDWLPKIEQSENALDLVHQVVVSKRNANALMSCLPMLIPWQA